MVERNEMMFNTFEVQGVQGIPRSGTLLYRLVLGFVNAPMLKQCHVSCREIQTSGSGSQLRL